MQTVDTIAHARAVFDVLPRPLGFVPTMGALHEGHIALVHRAREQCSALAASVFVNPLQFGANEDLARYPRDLEGDKEKLGAAGVDVLFTPGNDVMYPPAFSTYVDVGKLGSVYEGAIRPEHFRGVTTVVAKLLHIVLPDTLYLGQKDAQQTAVLRRMVADLEFPVRVVIVPTVREADGLAMSSRNAYLTPEQRQAAPTLHQALLALHDGLLNGATKEEAIALARAKLSPLATPDYFDVVDATSFDPLEKIRPYTFVIGAARFGNTRLLDNLHVTSVS